MLLVIITLIIDQLTKIWAYNSKVNMNVINGLLNFTYVENSVITLESNYEQRYEGFDPNSSESYIIFELMQDQNMEKSVKLSMVKEYIDLYDKICL